MTTCSTMTVNQSKNVVIKGSATIKITDPDNIWLGIFFPLITRNVNTGAVVPAITEVTLDHLLAVLWWIITFLHVL